MKGTISAQRKLLMSSVLGCVLVIGAPSFAAAFSDLFRHFGHFTERGGEDASKLTSVVLTVDDDDAKARRGRMSIANSRVAQSGSAGPLAIEAQTTEAASTNHYASVGGHFLWKVHSAFLKPDDVPNATVKMYANRLSYDNGTYAQSNQPAFLWTQDYLIKALYWGARVNPTRYRPLLDKALTQLDWYHTGCIGGYAFLHKNAQCFFDDNALLGGILTDVYLNVVNTAAAKTKMYNALHYVEDNRNSHGGVPQKPNDPDRDVKYYMGPVVTLARSYAKLATRYPNSPDADHQLELAKSYFAQVNDPALGLLRDSGLFIGRTTWVGPGNTWEPANIGPVAGSSAGVVKLALDLYQKTGDASKLAYAENLMTTIMNNTNWIMANGGVNQFASNGGAGIVDALCTIYEIDHKQKWYGAAKKIIDFITEQGRDQDNWFANGVPGAGDQGKWSEVREGDVPDDPTRLLPQAAAAAAILQFAYTDMNKQ